MKEIKEVVEEFSGGIPKVEIETGMNLLNRKLSGEINLDEFIKECAYWRVKDMLKYEPQPLPTRPAGLIDYDNKKRKDIRYSVKADFWQEPEVFAYINQKHQISTRNIIKLQKLKELLKDFEKIKDPTYPSMLRAVIRKFDYWIDNNWEQVKGYFKS